MISNQSEQPSSEDWSSTPSPLDAPPPHEADEGAGGEEMIVEQMLKLSRQTGLRVQGTIKTAEGNEHAAFRSRLCAPPVGRQRLPSPRDNLNRETDKGLQDQVAVGCVTSAAASLFKGSGGEGGGSEGMLKADAAGGDSAAWINLREAWSGQARVDDKQAPSGSGDVETRWLHASIDSPSAYSSMRDTHRSDHSLGQAAGQQEASDQAPRVHFDGSKALPQVARSPDLVSDVRDEIEGLLQVYVDS